MKKEALNKDIFRDIKKTKGRFFSIMAMIAIGVLVFVGLKVTGPEMTRIGDEYMLRNNAADITVVSTYGIDDKDRELLKSVPGYKYLDFGYSVDLLTKSEEDIVRIQSMPRNVALIEVVEGRLPKKYDEIILDRDLQSRYEIGDTIYFKDEKSIDEDNTNYLKHYDFKIVGFGTSSEYITNTDKGSTNIGFGEITGFGAVLENQFKSKEYSIARYSFDDLVGVKHSSDEFVKRVAVHASNVEEALDGRDETKFDELKIKLVDEINDGDKKINDARDELRDAEVKLNDARVELNDFFDEYDESKGDFHSKIAEAKQKLKDAEAELADGKTKLEDGKAKLIEEESKFNDGIREYEDGKVELEKGRKEYEDGLKQFVEGSETLASGEKELNEGKEKLKEGEIELLDGIKQYEDGLKQYKEGKAELEANRKILETSKTQLDAAKTEIDQGKALLDEGYAEYESSKEKVDAGIAYAQGQVDSLNSQKIELENQLSEIRQAESEIDNVNGQISDLHRQIDETTDEETLNQLYEQLNGLKEIKKNLDYAISQKDSVETGLQGIEGGLVLANEGLEEAKAGLVLLEAGKVELDKNLATWEVGKAEYDKGKAEYDSGYAQFQEGEKLLVDSGKQLEDAKAEIDKGTKEIADNKKLLEEKTKELEDGKKELADSKAKLQEAEKEIASGTKELEDAKKEIDDGRVKLEDAKKEIAENEEKLIDGEKEFSDGKTELVDNERKGKNELNDAWIELQEGKDELNEKFDEYEEERIKAEKEIDDAEEKLDDARDLLKVLKKPYYTVESRDNNAQVFFYFDSAIRLDFISNIFPVFFYLIALFVSLTTMTRMVDEQRLEIGTLKALGYSNYDIMKKYFIYGGVASLIGGLFGILVGHEIISKLIFDAYAGSYIFTSTRIKYNVFYSIMAIIIGFVCTAISAIFAAKSSLEENAAILMRGKPPKSGTRIFLERVKPVWNKLNFMQKVTARNMFRYKKRMFMTILGVSGCTALLFLGLGIQDSIGSIMDKQFGDIYKYNVISIYDEDFGETSYSKYQEMINSDDRIEKSEKVFVDNVDIDNPGGLTQSVMMMVPESNEEFYELVSLRDRKSQSPVEIKDGGVIINEKLATIYDKKIGDTIVFKDSDMVQYEVVINGITENYSGHNMYMNSSYYDEVFGEKYSPNADLIEFVSPGADENQLLIEDIIANKSIMSVVNMDVTTTFLDDVMGTLDIIVYVIIVCASVLAFVVLYNLTNINISERMRELSTIKVLGFYPKEVTSYVYRETLILTSMGIVVGYLFGFIMHRMIINNLLPDNVMLNPQITIRNLVISAILTLIFSFIVMISVHKKLKDIDMIEALKAVE